MTDPVLYVIACAAPPAQDVGQLVRSQARMVLVRCA